MNRKERLETFELSTELTAVQRYLSFRGRKPVVFWIMNLLAYFSPSDFKRYFLRLKGSEIGEGTLISQTLGVDYVTPENIEIGRNCVIGHSATILSHEMLADRIRIGPTTIGDSVVIGANSTILPGVKIGDDATIAAGAVVTRDVEEGQTVAGVPARPIKSKEKSLEKSD